MRESDEVQPHRPHSTPRDTSRATPDDLEQAWRAKQGPDVAMRYKFRLPAVAAPLVPGMCSSALRNEHGYLCVAIAIWRVARSPYSTTGVRYYCAAHCPDVPEGTP